MIMEWANSSLVVTIISVGAILWGELQLIVALDKAADRLAKNVRYRIPANLSLDEKKWIAMNLKMCGKQGWIKQDAP